MSQTSVKITSEDVFSWIREALKMFKRIKNLLLKHSKNINK